MLKKFAIGIVVLLAVILGLAATKPDTFSVQRTVLIKAPPEKIMPYLSDFHQWVHWSPWEHLDPAMVRTFSGANQGKGAIYHWKGNSDVGEGRMEILSVEPPSRLDIKLDFITPLESSNTTSFTLTPQADGTSVTWTTSGPLHFITKIVCVFTTMEKLIGPDFDRGMAKLKAVAEK